MQLLWVDLSIIGLIALSVLTGLFRGFVKELIALCVWILAIWLAYHYYYSLDPFLKTYIKDKHMRTAAAFVIILVATLIVGGLFNSLLNFIIKRTGLSGTDRALGMGFGLVRGIFIVALLMVAARMTSLPYQQYAKQSKLYVQFDPVVAWLYAKLPQWITEVKNLEVTENNMEKIPLTLKASLETINNKPRT